MGDSPGFREVLLRLLIEKLVPGGEGLARHEGRVVFVPGVLPGEEVEAGIVASKRDFARARLPEILRPSPDRVSPPCPLAGTCGGCDWQHVSSPAQARFKVEMVRDALRRIGKIEWPNLEIEPGAPLGYRNRLQFHTDGSGAAGFLERGGRGFVPVKKCPVAHPAFAPLFEKGCAPGAPKRFQAFAFTEADGTLRLWRGDENPDAGIRIEILGREILFPLRGFFQSNLAMLERLIPHALDGLSGDRVFDLYSGVGLFGAFLRPPFRRLVCVESNAEALRCAERNVGTKGATFIYDRVESWARRLAKLPNPEQPDAVVADPPREGLDPAVRKWLKQRAVPRLVYVSCDPVTLARDLKDLAGPYVLEDLRLFDFYPQTHHVEAVAKLRARLDTRKS